ncbi:MAG: glycosyltransferase family 4 protein [Nitrososphaeraceae archaeon]
MKILMVSTEYPPMQGGVGRYCKKLVDSLRNQDVEVRVVCNEDGQGDYTGISPLNPDNSDILLKIVKEYQPDHVHVQYEPGLYGIHLDPLNPNKTCTNIEAFYRECKVPIVTTFHSAYTFRQWMSLVVPLVNKNFGKIGTWLRVAYDYWTHFLNYRSFKSLNTQKIGPNRKGIVFSRYLANLIPGSHLIYHGSEPSLIPAPDKMEARRKFSLPEEGNIALALGFLTATKGLDIIRKMKVPAGWKIVVNTSRNHYNMEKIKEEFDNEGVIELGKGFLVDKELSLLLYSADALILPYKVSSGSGVMYDGLAHGLPFVSSNIEFFKEFSNLGLGISVERDPLEFSKAFLKLERDYEKYENAVEIFRRKLAWKEVAKKHISLYESIRISAEDLQVLEKYV